MKLRNALSSSLLVLCLLAVSTLANAQTSIGGPISTNTTLTLAASPYTITSDIMVQSGATLTIEPGVAIDFPGTSRDLIVEGGGNLICEGTSSQRINLFSSNGFGGGSLYVMDGGSASLDYTDFDTLGISTLTVNDCAIRLDDVASFTMDNSTIERTQVAIRGNADAFSSIGGANTFDADVNVFGFTLNSTATWPQMDPAGTIYSLEGDIEILSGIFLTVDPGVTVNLNGTGRDILVRDGGFFVCEGTTSDRITLGSENGFGGGSLYVFDGGSASVKRTDISDWGSSTITAFDCAIRVDDGGTLLLANSTINNTLAAIRADADALSTASENNTLGSNILIFGASLDKSTTWPNIDPAGARYIVLGDNTIAAGLTLTINPGVIVDLDAPAVDLIVDGTLNAIGTSTNQITFTSSNSFGGGSIFGQDGCEINLDYCTLDLLGASTLSAHDAGIRISEGTLVVENTTITNAQWSVRGDADSFGDLGDNNNFDAPIRVLANTLDVTSTWPKVDPTGVTYSVVGDQTIASGNQLTIEGGVTVDMTAASVDLLVDGNLLVDGSWDDRTIFNSSNSFGGGSVYFRPGSTGTMEYFEIDRLGASTLSNRDAGISIDNADVDLFTGFISNSQRGIRIDNGSDAITINGVDFTGNDIGIDINSMTSSPTVRYSTFMGNSPFAVDNGSPTITLDACFNYWGDASGPYDSSNPSSVGDTITGMIDAIGCATDESALTDCAAPIELSNTVASPDVITFNWTRVPVAAGYRINAARTPDMVGFQSVQPTKSVPGVVTGDTVVWSVKAGCFFSPGVLDISPKSVEVVYVVGPLRTASPEVQVDLFPNPATSQITITMPTNLQEKGALAEVIDMQGRVVMTQRLAAGTAHLMDINELTSGNYFLQLHGNGESFASSFAVK